MRDLLKLKIKYEFKNFATMTSITSQTPGKSERTSSDTAVIKETLTCEKTLNDLTKTNKLEIDLSSLSNENFKSVLWALIKYVYGNIHIDHIDAMIDNKVRSFYNRKNPWSDRDQKIPRMKITEENAWKMIIVSTIVSMIALM
jgi:hypothetical protein